MEKHIEKNKQVFEFISIIKEVDKNGFNYSMTKNMFLDFLEFINMPWDEYTNTKTKEEIIKDYKYFSFNVYLPF